MPNEYVHGYSERENTRLQDQANTLSELLHQDTTYPPGSIVLEAGCGTGAQTVFLAQNSPGARFISIDIAEASLEVARTRAKAEHIHNVIFEQADIFHLPFGEQSFDHIFLCFVLEHLLDPIGAILRLKGLLRQDGSITVIEGDHGSAFYYPESEFAMRAIQCLVEIQAELGGNSLIGRQLFPLLKKAGLRNITVSPRMVYADSSRPQMVEGFTKNTFTAMVEGVAQEALSRRLISTEQWKQGIADLHATAGPVGVFCYTFFKAIAFR